MRFARIITHPGFAVLVPAVVGFGAVTFCVRFFEFYGWSLFLGVPVLVTFLSAFCTAYRTQVGYGTAYWRAVGSLLCLGALILLVALDGLICLVMALPLALLLANLGARLGWLLGRAKGPPAPPPAALLLIVLAFPGLVAFESATRETPPLREVTTRVTVYAPIDRVWETVIAFPRITAPPTGIFRWGIAYPLEARIEGNGVGAIRRCIFSTRAFVEPITHWDAPHRLAFEVAASPPPMREISFYEHVEAPHLHGTMISERGEFRLREEAGQTILEGTTWYTHSLAPQWYWGPISDTFIHRIHERVLNHIEAVSEGR